ncbi:MAG TPA: hypothetical protein VF573_03795 [Paraburkholderia sp.]|uniref:hypothetical protein n=1 Tax=Paraburkholderia sp. TaxID=1926495 RepID=UPI002ED2E512
MRQTIHRLLLAALLAATTGALAESIQIESGTYGANCGASRGNVTRVLAGHCNGLDTCQYPLVLSKLTQNRQSCPADLVAEWSCGAGQFHEAVVRAAATTSGTLVLSCLPSTGAGK